ncbi:(2Fe-2S)-binding protein [Flexivirga meconopsidis]|uniref:(2Fe-2S)-binding protein n=1 Tax=Flexivirga meconopsidis TaxID=2977121 RepID=UPI00223F5187|nr:(2Fe-2S)-binding protein [Flexivirga meconopsidis]
MPSHAMDPGVDPAHPTAAESVTITVDGVAQGGIDGQTIAGILLAAGRGAWRRTSGAERPRGVFCGIGVCFDCIATVNGVRDVRLCQRRAADGDVVETQHDALPVRVDTARTGGGDA